MNKDLNEISNKIAIHAHNLVLIDKERVLEELLNIEGALIYRLTIRRDEKELEPELCDAL